MVLKPNQIQVTTHKQMQSLSEYTKLVIVNDMLRSYDLENNHENTEEQEEDNPFDYFLQLTAWLQGVRSTYHTTLRATPCPMFGRDMIHNIAFRANWY
jgi:hypothetical protein